MNMLLLSVFFIWSMQSLGQSAHIDRESNQQVALLRNLPRVKRVIGGEILTDISKWPWLANLDGKFCSGWWIFSSCTHTYCGASIINDRWVMTAAHCMKHPDAKIGNKWHVKIGEEKFEQGVGTRFISWLKRLFGDTDAYQKIHGEKVIVHEKADGWLNDIALIKLANPIPFHRDDIGPVMLPPQSVDKSWPEDGAVCVTKGWGCTAKGDSVSDVAMVVTLQKTSDVTCELAYWGHNQPDFTQNRLCAGKNPSSPKQGICKGDSGGPLVCKQNNKWVQAGVASFNSPSDPGTRPSGFTRVSYYTDWIHDKMRNN